MSCLCLTSRRTYFKVGNHSTFGNCRGIRMRVTVSKVAVSTSLSMVGVLGPGHFCLLWVSSTGQSLLQSTLWSWLRLCQICITAHSRQLTWPIPTSFPLFSHRCQICWVIWRLSLFNLLLSTLSFMSIIHIILKNRHRRDPMSDSA